ncbi:class I SAM-dependent methyltransferase [Methylorubrum thiocyanatum]|uniref:class I SAM-dependent methyltransferase n=1 Tax=Methylorubrum thiocyanatum TaxID=47958 RepID=UPI00383BCA7C
MSDRFSHGGRDYKLILKDIHDFMQPKTYLEIGTREGYTLALANCDSIAVDPFFVIEGNPVGKRKKTFYFQTTSDDFFKNNDPELVLKDKLDFCFLDGLHEWETLLRDFINTEKYCNKNSIIAVHDCFPSDAAMASRADNGGWWTGDVWKLIPVLKQYRPDLNLFMIDAPPTGLLLITNLNSESKRLGDEYFSIVQEWRDIELASYGLDKLFSDAQLIPTSSIERREDMSRYFWIA